MPRTVNDMAVVFVLAGTIHTAYGLNGIDVADFLIKEKRMQLRLIESCLQFINHDNQTVLRLAEVLDYLIFAHATIQCGTRLVLLVITIDDGDRCILVFFKRRFLTFLIIQCTYYIEILDGMKRFDDYLKETDLGNNSDEYEKVLKCFMDNYEKLIREKRSRRRVKKIKKN